MKALVAVALVIIAAAVLYLAFQQYRERRALEEVGRAFADPDGYLAEQWAEQADLDCAYFEDVLTAPMRNGRPRPTSFTCVTNSLERWLISERPCTDGEMEVQFQSASGPPSDESQVFKPVSVLCWSIDRIK